MYDIEVYEKGYVENLELQIEILTNEKQEYREKVQSLTNLVYVLLEEIKELDQKEENTYFNKNDIMRIFDCGKDKARNILKFAQQVNLATSIGNDIVISKKNMSIFIEKWYNGTKVNITY